ncbi:MAG: response regulator [Pseudomonadota bacterium]
MNTGTSTQTPSRPPRILIVEDEVFVAMDIERILVDAGFNVHAIATDRREALANASGADVAFVDLNLRDGPTGEGIAAELARTYSVRVVYVTANPAQIVNPAENAVGFIRKPFDDTAIVAAAAIASNRAVSVDASSAITLFTL